MKKTFSQKALRFISILQFLSGLTFLLLIVLLALGVNNEDINALVKQKETEVIIDLIKLFVNTVLLFISWHILKQVSKDASKHNKALTITMIVIAFEVFNFITSLGTGVPRNLAAMVTSVFINLVAVYFISKTREAYHDYLYNN